MLQSPVSRRKLFQLTCTRMKSSSSFIRNTFIEYFIQNHGHKHVKSSSVVPFHDPTVPFVNAGMNQFKGVFLGKVSPPCARAVNSQKCIRVGGKHNDLDVVGTDGHHHTFFEMLGNWSFGDYYKKEACKMAWDLLLGPYRLKPEQLVVTYFGGDVILNLIEDRECRDIWKEIGVPKDRIKGMGAADNFWEMGTTGPCGPCTEIHYINDDGSLTEIWNIVFIQFNRETDGTVTPLETHHVDTGMGLERVSAILQRVRGSYSTDLFLPLLAAIHQHSPGSPPYGDAYGEGAALDAAYRRLADHARMVAVCLADGVFPATSLNLKQIMRKSFKISADVFNSPHLLSALYDEVADTLGDAYPELRARRNDAKLILEHEQESYAKMRKDLSKRWRELTHTWPEAAALEGDETAGLARGYTDFKQMMSKQNSNVIPGELVFKLYDTYGFQEDLIQKIATLNNLEIDKKEFWKLLTQHRSRHKTAFKEQNAKTGDLFSACVKNLIYKDYKCTNDQHKYDYAIENIKLVAKPLKTKLIAILNEELEWIDHLEPCESKPYYLVTEDTNFYCEEGGQIADTGVIRLKNNVILKVDSVFKIRDFVFHKGCFKLESCKDSIYISCGIDVQTEIDTEKRLRIMRNHTSVHLLNAAIRKVLPNSVVYQIGSGVTDSGLYLNLSVYGEKLSQRVILEAQELIRHAMQSNAAVTTRVIDSMEMSEQPSLLTVPGETYPETGIRLVAVDGPLESRELCCGTHVPALGAIQEFCVTLVKGANSMTPTVRALTGHAASEARELFCCAEKLNQVIDLVNPTRKQDEINHIKSGLAELCGTSGAPYGEYKQCLELLDDMQKRPPLKNYIALQAVAQAEMEEACSEAARSGRGFVVHFLRCSYLMPEEALGALEPARGAPQLLMGCAGGVIVAVCRVPEEMVSPTFSASRWLSCVLPVLGTPLRSGSTDHIAHITPTKVSLINCEQLVQDAMRVAIRYAQAHATGQPQPRDGTEGDRARGRSNS